MNNLPPERPSGGWQLCDVCRKRPATRTAPDGARLCGRSSCIYVPQGTSDRAVKKQGRNELCACGSGKKFKVCCLKTRR